MFVGVPGVKITVFAASSLSISLVEMVIASSSSDSSILVTILAARIAAIESSSTPAIFRIMIEVGFYRISSYFYKYMKSHPGCGRWAPSPQLRDFVCCKFSNSLGIKNKGGHRNLQGGIMIDACFDWISAHFYI